MSGNELVRGKIKARWYKPDGTPCLCLDTTNLLYDVEEVALLLVTDTGVGGLEPWMVEWLGNGDPLTRYLPKELRHATSTEIDRFIANAIERILKEGGEG